ncbi:hypothetical protein A9Q83_04365 [Alphaproteobacteria bacterium 46_93_T64]|nr:hypothetical protein A9Q83_04365 [Alphaproteobacteria bacterium 46_93_T64]
MSKNIRTFRTLLTKDNMNANQLAQLVKVKGTLYRNRWGAWEAALPENAETQDKIETALNELSNYASSEIYRDSSSLEEYYDSSIHHPLDNFGFTTRENNELFIKKTTLQNHEERIEVLISELASASKESNHLKEQLTNLKIELEGANEKLDQLIEKTTIDDLRAIAVHTWLHSNGPCSRKELWASMQEIDTSLFGNTNSDVATERAVDRVSNAHKQRYKKAFKYSDSNN